MLINSQKHFFFWLNTRRGRHDASAHAHLSYQETHPHKHKIIKRRQADNQDKALNKFTQFSDGSQEKKKKGHENTFINILQLESTYLENKFPKNFHNFPKKKFYLEVRAH